MMNQEYVSTETQWCPGCGNFSILSSLLKVMNNLDVPKNNVVFMGGIGQAPKLNQFIPANGFSGLHGRVLPAATGVHVGNPELKIVINSGDGDSYGEGGNHLIHTIRRNPNMTHFVHNNQIYGLTTGQPSPTTDLGDLVINKSHAKVESDEEPTTSQQSPTTDLDDNSPELNPSIPLRPLGLALAAGATFVARCFSGDQKQMEEIMKAAIEHKGYALVDILQPCVTFNKVNTFGWYKDRVRPVGPDHDPTDKDAGRILATTWGDEIPTGILYQVEEPVYTERRAVLNQGLIPAQLKTTDQDREDRLKTFL